jgi:hypothetical protein
VLAKAASELLTTVLGPARPRGLADIARPKAIENARVAVSRSAMSVRAPTIADRCILVCFFAILLTARIVAIGAVGVC